MNLLDDLIRRYPSLTGTRNSIEAAASLVIESIESGGKIMVCGNGGSCADADHIVGELMKGFALRRTLTYEQKEALKETGGERGQHIGESLQQAIPAVSLGSQMALLTAFMNDVDPSLVYAQQVIGLGRRDDLFWGISTSGSADNVISAAITAKSIGAKTLAMTGKRESQLSEICDLSIQVDEQEPFKVQELHLPVYHTICLIVENHFFH